jgi:hypothetical protein
LIGDVVWYKGGRSFGGYVGEPIHGSATFTDRQCTIVKKKKPNAQVSVLFTAQVSVFRAGEQCCPNPFRGAVSTR